MACTIDESSLPILTGCPAPNELIVVENAVGGLDANGMLTVGYARRYIKDLIHCFLSNLNFNFFQFTVGQPGAPILDGGVTAILIPPTGMTIIQDSVSVVFGGSVMDRDDNTTFSYDVQYNNPSSGEATITFNQPVQNTQTYIIFYTYA